MADNYWGLRVSSPYGKDRGTYKHGGVDLSTGGKSGVACNANIAGTVIFTGYEANGFGNYVKIKDADGNVHYYGHLASINVKTGQMVSVGMKIGVIGSTGRSTGNHLHYEVRNNGKSVDPAKWINGSTSNPNSNPRDKDGSTIAGAASLPKPDSMREWGVEEPSVATKSAVEDAKFYRKDLDVTGDMYIGSEVIRTVKDKIVEVGVGYLIYFDNVLMNKYVVSFSSSVSTSGNIETASIELLYTPTFWKTEVRDSCTNLYQSIDAIENQTSVRIFVMNVITRKFDIVFDGDIKQKQRRKGPRGKSIVYTAKCHMDWLNRITVPVSIPLTKTLSNGDQIRWLAQGIDLSKIDTITFAQETSFKGKTLSQFLQDQIEKTFLNNRLFSDPNTVAAWDDAVNRICIMGDIDPQLRAAQCIDFIVSASTTIVDTMYTVVHQTATNLLIEYFSDRDGMIRIKPPFWNQPVLKDHIIDPMFILNQSDLTDWENFYTRVIATGGNEEWVTSGGSSGKYVESDFLTPVGAYIGDMKNSENAFWADFTGIHLKFREPDSTAGLWLEENKSQYIDINTKQEDRAVNVDGITEFKILYDYGQKSEPSSRASINESAKTHTGIDFYLPDNFTEGKQTHFYSKPIYHIGTTGTITKMEQEDEGLWTIVVRNNDGVTVRYEHLGNIELSLCEGAEVNTNTRIANGGSVGHGEYKSWHLSVQKNHSYIDPIAYINGNVDLNTIRGLSTSEGARENFVGPPTATGAVSVVDQGIDRNNATVPVVSRQSEDVVVLNESISYLNPLLIPSNDERKYGPNILEVNQSMIKFSTSKGVEDSADAAMALRKYSQFMYYMMNSSLDTCSVSILAMPWLRPGFNVWLNPVDDDKIYYINSISYQGSPDSGVTSSLELSMGRERRVFTTEPNAFGSQKETCDNLLISEFIKNQTADKFGTVLGGDSEYEAIKEAAFQFYNSSDDNVKGGESEAYFQSLYGSTNTSPDAISLATIKLEEDEDADKTVGGTVGKCGIEAVSSSDLVNLNYGTNSDGQRVLDWPVKASYTITNGQGESHHGIDIYCGDGSEEAAVTAMSSGIVVSIEKNSSGYTVEVLEMGLLGDNNITKTTYGHVDNIDPLILQRYEDAVANFGDDLKDAAKREAAVHKEYDLYKSKLPYVEQGNLIGGCSKDLHVSFSQRQGEDDSAMYSDKAIVSHLRVNSANETNATSDTNTMAVKPKFYDAEGNPTNVFSQFYDEEQRKRDELWDPATVDETGRLTQNNVFADIYSAKNKVTFDSTKHRDADTKDVEKKELEIEENLANAEDAPISSFCSSDKFFQREMSFAEIDAQIQSMYASAPPIIQNRITGLAARIAEADRYVERFYETEKFTIWQDVKQFSAYVAQNGGYKTGEWVSGVYESGITEEAAEGTTGPAAKLLPYQSKYTQNTSAMYNSEGGMSASSGNTISIPDGYGTQYTYMGWQHISMGKNGDGKNSKGQYLSDQAELRAKAGTNFDSEGYAIVDGKRVIATTSKMGKVGDYVNVTLEDGSVMECIIGDTKDTDDAGANEYGHNGGKATVEFVVDKNSWYGKKDNPKLPKTVAITNTGVNYLK